MCVVCVCVCVCVCACVMCIYTHTHIQTCSVSLMIYCVYYEVLHHMHTCTGSDGLMSKASNTYM